MHLINMKKDKNIVNSLGYCFVSNLIIQQKQEIGYMYKEFPDDDDDSGWRFFSGNETEDYMNNPDNFAIYSVESIISIDERITQFINSDFGSEFILQNGIFVELKGGPEIP